LFLDESVMDRLVRFCNILKVTSVRESDGSDIPRTVKILDKLPQVRFPLFPWDLPARLRSRRASETAAITCLHVPCTATSSITSLPLYPLFPLRPSAPLLPCPSVLYR
jgi:hypothetical protein